MCVKFCVSERESGRERVCVGVCVCGCACVCECERESRPASVFLLLERPPVCLLSVPGCRTS